MLNTQTSRWDPLASTHGKTAHWLTTTIPHFSSYAIIGKSKVAPLPPPPPPAPARFTLSDVAVTPAQVTTGQAVTISARVNNTGGTAGDYDVTLKVNGAVESTKKVNVEAGSTATVIFTLTAGASGAYQVNVNRQTSSFNVESAAPAPVTEPAQAPPSEEPPRRGSGWIPVVVGIGAALIVLVIVIAFIRNRRARQPRRSVLNPKGGLNQSEVPFSMLMTLSQSDCKHQQAHGRQPGSSVADGQWKR